MTSLFEDQQKTLKDCTERFERLGIKYMLTGSMAMVNYAMMRMTNDIDIVIQIERGDAPRIVAEFAPDYYVAIESIQDAVNQRRMFNMLHQTTIVKVDCMIRKDSEFQIHAFGRRRNIDFNGIAVWIIDKHDLILSKLNWAKETRSEMQMRDVAGMIRNGYDDEYVRQWAKKLGVEDILEDCIKLLGENYVEGYN